MACITTILTTYRRPELLKRAVKSVLSQTYPYFQLVVYDNASGDETQEIMERFVTQDSRVKYHQHAENLGMIGNYEYGVSEIQTPYFSFLSDDDLVLPWFYETALEGFKTYPDIAFSACSTVIVNQAGRVIAAPFSLWKTAGHIRKEEGMQHMIGKFPVPTGVLFDSRILKNIRIDRDNQVLWDCDFLLQVARKYPIFISKKTCALFLHHGGSFSSSNEFEVLRSGVYRLMERFSSTENDFLFTRWINEISLGYIARQLRAQSYKRAYNLAIFCMRTCGPSIKAIIFLIVASISPYFPLDRVLFFLSRQWRILFRKNQIKLQQDFSQWL